MRKFRAFGLFLLLCAALTVSAGAEEAVYTGSAFEAEGFSNSKRLWDGSQTTWSATKDGGRITVSREDGVAGLYLLFDRPPQPWTLNGTVACGEDGFLHQYVDVSALLGSVPAGLTLDFPAGTALSEIYAFSPGDLPGWVQRWEPPLEEADLMLVSTHSDDEQLFFAGLLPYYAVERELDVQVVYFVQHFEVNGQQDHRRPHEQLDGLWTVGIRNYPIISDFPDLYAESKNRVEALSRAKAVFRRAGAEDEDFVGYLVSCIRRCRPLVVAGHDLDGEYGHGAHVLCADALTRAVEAAAGPGQYPGEPWAVEKLYLHLYEENPVVLDLDTPSDRLGGKSPFQVTQEGFACHKSQHWTWFYKWIYGTKANPITRAADIRTYSPCRYGLYYTAAGPDEAGDDLFEHVETYTARRARLEAEERAAREAAEAEARRQAEAEARAKAEEEARAEEEAALAEALRREQTRQRTLFRMAAVSAGALVLCAALLLAVKRHR